MPFAIWDFKRPLSFYERANISADPSQIVHPAAQKWEMRHSDDIRYPQILMHLNRPKGKMTARRRLNSFAFYMKWRRKTERKPIRRISRKGNWRWEILAARNETTALLNIYITYRGTGQTTKILAMNAEWGIFFNTAYKRWTRSLQVIENILPKITDKRWEKRREIRGTRKRKEISGISFVLKSLGSMLREYK